MSAVIPRNQIVGIVGKSGSGKSTLLKLLMRFWRPVLKNLVAGKSIEQINLHPIFVKWKVCYTGTYLFHDSIR